MLYNLVFILNKFKSLKQLDFCFKILQAKWQNGGGWFWVLPTATTLIVLQNSPVPILHFWSMILLPFKTVSVNTFSLNKEFQKVWQEMAQTHHCQSQSKTTREKAEKCRRSPNHKNGRCRQYKCIGTDDTVFTFVHFVQYQQHLLEHAISHWLTVCSKYNWTGFQPSRSFYSNSFKTSIFKSQSFKSLTFKSFF